MRRPFWMHQIVEYILGVLLVSQGLQASKPMVPALLGGLVLLNAATAQGPVAAFPKVPRRVHRVIDLVLLAAIVIAVGLPSSAIDDSARLILAGVAAVLGYVVWKTDYTTKVTRRQRRAATAPAADAPQSAKPSMPSPSAPGASGASRTAPAIDSEQIGRVAGRTAGRLYNAARRRRRS